MSEDGSELLSYVKRIALAAERIADHLTKQSMRAVDGTPEKPARYYGQTLPQRESHDAKAERPAQRPKQANRS